MLPHQIAVTQGLYESKRNVSLTWDAVVPISPGHYSNVSLSGFDDYKLVFVFISDAENMDDYYKLDVSGAIGYLQPSVIPLGAGYAAPVNPFVTLSPWATSPTPSEMQKGTARIVIEFRRQASQTPARWSVAATCYSTSGDVRRVACSGVSHPQTDLNGMALATIALGLWNDSGSAGAANFSVARLRVLSLD